MNLRNNFSSINKSTVYRCPYIVCVNNIWLNLMDNILNISNRKGTHRNKSMSHIFNSVANRAINRGIIYIMLIF